MQGGDFNLYENMRCHGVPLVTISRGRVVYENGVFMCAEGTGKFCPLRSFPDTVYKKLVQREKVRCGMGISYDCFKSQRCSHSILPPRPVAGSGHSGNKNNREEAPVAEQNVLERFPMPLELRGHYELLRAEPNAALSLTPLLPL